MADILLEFGEVGRELKDLLLLLNFQMLKTEPDERSNEVDVYRAQNRQMVSNSKAVLKICFG